MKNKFILFSAIFTLVISMVSCDKLIDQLTSFDIPFSNTFTIPANTVINIPIDITTPDITTNSSSTFEANQTSTDLIKKVSITKFDLELLTPPTGNFDFLKDITIYVSADGVTEQKIASKLNMSNAGLKKLSLDLTTIDLKQFIIKDKLKLRAEVTTDEAITQDYTIKTDLMLKVEASVLN